MGAPNPYRTLPTESFSVPLWSARQRGVTGWICSGIACRMPAGGIATRVGGRPERPLVQVWHARWWYGYVDCAVAPSVWRSKCGRAEVRPFPEGEGLFAVWIADADWGYDWTWTTVWRTQAKATREARRLLLLRGFCRQCGPGHQGKRPGRCERHGKRIRGCWQGLKLLPKPWPSKDAYPRAGTGAYADEAAALANTKETP